MIEQILYAAFVTAIALGSYWIGVLLGMEYERERRMKEFDRIYGWKRKR